MIFRDKRFVQRFSNINSFIATLLKNIYIYILKNVNSFNLNYRRKLSSVFIAYISRTNLRINENNVNPQHNSQQAEGRMAEGTRAPDKRAGNSETAIEEYDRVHGRAGG